MQKIVTISTTEASYVVVTEASKKLIWLQRLLEELGFKPVIKMCYTVTVSVIHLTKNSVFHYRTKHIGMRYHFVLSLIDDRVLKLMKISRSKYLADMLTNSITTEKLKLCVASTDFQG